MRHTKKISVILAGGANTRFGSHKAFACYQGRPLIDHLMETLHQTGFLLFLSGQKNILKKFNLPIIEDDEAQQGPLRAMRTIWKALPYEKAVIVACDMPFLTPPLADHLWNVGSQHDIVLLKGVNGPSPLPGVYAKSLIPAIEKTLREGDESLLALLRASDSPSLIPRDEWYRYDPQYRSLLNINTREDLQQCSKTVIT
ncbi:MAG: hypothetical protein A3I05_02260 [Deltaproteobacteria bacterium RIFCSPLOWO2_02_FULL_44_10]|nr:MAG: hypothetical protein A3C46_08425 [Deltaproteobacteria bacterium RIFCSPHIGHO2_02_FULL_44_16]OGQ47599.1 MAG: hypothetical protein A3I05_02260 [Deltaproteobacteria bacterium RIFCSPLOWO2_02_FULL_44_10]